MRHFLPSLLFMSIYGQTQEESAAISLQKPSAILAALSVYEDKSPRTKRQCGAGGCGGGCRGGYGCGGGSCRGYGCGGGGCRGSGCGGGCLNPCGAGDRLCCDNVAPRPCVGCGLNRGIYPEPVPLAVGVGGTCCACCMPVCAPRCVSYGCGSCGRGGYGGYDYFDYYG